MTNIIVNGTAVVRTSLGARRYYEGIRARLDWPGEVLVSPPARWSRWERPGELLQRGRRDAIFWSPSHRGPLFAHRHVVTVLDCINVEHTYRGDARLPLIRWLFDRLLGNAVAVVTISRATRDAVLRNFSIDPSKLVVIAGPVDFGEGEHVVATATADRSEPPFILMITNALPHKNTSLACQALAASRAARLGVGLRVVGSLDSAGLAACRRAGVHVEEHRGIDDATLGRWISGSRFVFSPSLDEGLNLPIAEALSLGANVLCSDIPVHREFYDGQVLFCDPNSLEAMQTAIDAALERGLPWQLPGRTQPRRTFADVASEYRKLFLRIAAEAPQYSR